MKFVCQECAKTNKNVSAKSGFIHYIPCRKCGTYHIIVEKHVLHTIKVNPLVKVLGG